MADFDVTYGTSLGVRTGSDNTYGTRLGVKTYYDVTHGTDLAIKVSDLSPITDITASGNEFEPTIVVNGEFISEHDSTNTGIDVIDDVCLYVAIKNAGMTNCSLCDLESFGMSLDDQGGSWSIDSLCSNLGECYDTVEVYGLRGTVGDRGFKIDSNKAAYTYSGTWGDPNLRRPFKYVVAGTPLGELISGQTLSEASITSWSTAAAGAGAVARIVGINLQWLVNDVPVTNFRIEENDTALGALSSLAQRAGGKLRWNGGRNWVVVYPDVYTGIWEVPHCDLLLPGFIKNCHCNLSTNYLTISSQPSTLNAGVVALPQPQGSAGYKAQLLTKFSKRLTVDSPPLIFDLPFNYDKVLVQILVNVGKSTSGANLVSLHNYMTTNPQEFFEYDASAFGIDYIFSSNIGGAVIPQVRVDYRCLPTEESNNTAINDGDFVFSIYYTQREFTPPNQDEEAAKNREALAPQNNFRYQKVCDYQFQVLFFGSIPLPGMLGRARAEGVKIYVPDCEGGYTTIDVGDVILEGIIESVSFSAPGYLTISMSSYEKLSFYNSRQIDYSP